MVVSNSMSESCRCKIMVSSKHWWEWQVNTVSLLEVFGLANGRKLQEEMKLSSLRLKGITRGLIRAVKEMDKEVVEAESIVAVV